MTSGWVGVDLDGTLAHWDEASSATGEIGPPIPRMVNRVIGWLKSGRDVRIVTARVGPLGRENVPMDDPWHPENQRAKIEAWCLQHFRQVLPLTCQKDYLMLELWDDRCVQVVPNTGMTVLEHALQTRDHGTQ